MTLTTFFHPVLKVKKTAAAAAQEGQGSLWAGALPASDPGHVVGCVP